MKYGWVMIVPAGISRVLFLMTLSRADVIFVDPDNGIVVPSAWGTVKENKFIKTSQRFYFFMIQPKHNEIIPVAVRKMLANGWSDCFEVVG